MIKNYFKIAFRALKKQKQYAFINVLGLAIGLAAVIILAHYILFHLNFDKHHDKYDKIYRTITKIKYPNGKKLSSPIGMSGVSNHLKEKYDYVKNSTTIYTLEMINKNYQHNDNELKLETYYTDKGFADIFDMKVIRGNLEKVL